MVNASSKRQIYKADIKLAFDYNGQRENIESEKILYIMIDHDYENKNMPIIYITMSVNSELYTKINKYKNSAKFYLSINKENVNGTMGLSKKSINDTFNYIPSDTNPNYSDTLNEGSMKDASYKKITVGLIDISITNTMRKSFNNIYNNIDQETLVGIALEGTKIVLEKLAYNNKYSSILVPAISSRLQFLKFIFDKDAFYDTNFRYYIDFDRSYLLSKTGDSVDAGDGELSSIIVNIRETTADESYAEGIEVRDGAYYVYINPANSNVSLNEGTEKVANQIVAVDDDSEIQKLDLDINNTEGSETKQTFMRTGNATLIKNELESNTVILEIVKPNIDGSIFTPNKTIMVNNYGDYSRYNGKYLMIYKKEFYKSIGGQFMVSCNVGLKKIGNIEPLGSTSSSNSSNLSVSKSATRKTTASKKYS